MNNNKIELLANVVKSITFKNGQHTYCFTNNKYNNKKLKLCKFLLTELSKITSSSETIKLNNFSYKIRKGLLYIVDFSTSSNSITSDEIKLSFYSIDYKVNKVSYTSKDILFFINNIDLDSHKKKYSLTKNNMIKNNDLLSYFQKKSTVLEEPLFAIQEAIIIHYSGPYSNPIVASNNKIATIRNFRDYIDNYSSLVQHKYSRTRKKLEVIQYNNNRIILDAINRVYEILNYLQILSNSYSNQILDNSTLNLYKESDFNSNSSLNHCYIMILDISILLNKNNTKFITNIYNGVYKCTIRECDREYLIETDKVELRLKSLKNLEPYISLHKTKKSADLEFKHILDNIKESIISILEKLKKELLTDEKSI